ncbi:MAG: DUF1800 domain-containing protein [Thermorudis peleae]|nr:DUF1800 domain-containing protein [Thermorudis peleae]
MERLLQQPLRRRKAVAGLVAAGLSALLAAYYADSRVSSSSLDERTLFRHLLRRAGFGLAPNEVTTWQSLGWDNAVDRLVNYEQVANHDLEALLAQYHFDLTTPNGIRLWWLVRMAYTARPLEEKMTLFWHGLLTSSLGKATPSEMIRQNQFFREHALDNYGVILKGISRDVAMMRWLDLAENRVGHPNENYARELMELFTMGPGHYTEVDVREAARAFTGLVLRKDGNDYVSAFVPSQHDRGSKTFLGRTGNFGPDDIVDIILEQPATAPFLATKLLRFFVTPTPSPELVERIATTLQKTNYSIKAAVKDILLLPEFREPSAYRSLIKSPVEYLVGAIRQLGAHGNLQFAPQALKLMGQDLFAPPNVAGWPGGTSWLNSGTWLARLNAANTLVTQRAMVQFDFHSLLGDPLPQDPQGVVDRLAEVFVDGQLADPQRQILYDHAGPAAAYHQSPDQWLDQQGRSLVYLFLALPEYHLN